MPNPVVPISAFPEYRGADTSEAVRLETDPNPLWSRWLTQVRAAIQAHEAHEGDDPNWALAKINHNYHIDDMRQRAELSHP